MERDQINDVNEAIELGTVSGDTLGGPGYKWEGSGFELAGLSAD